LRLDDAAPTSHCTDFISRFREFMSFMRELHADEYDLIGQLGDLVLATRKLRSIGGDVASVAWSSTIRA
jgi:hypothetical protein